ncbi:hypothetical protein HHI36_018554 [Cryptolaemus montrouzieri]|uniref:arginine kinase n=1 Tax=Cryptolaemus montrouzieri TaxID=559131 RepID=A0ABD2P0N7_9CUCU
MAFLRCPQCSLKCGTHFIPYDILRHLRMGFRKLEYSQSRSLLKKYLTEEMLEYLKFRRTRNDVNLYDCIKCGLQYHDVEIGIYACDPDSYFVFSPIFFPILEEIHQFGETNVHPKSAWLPINSVANLDSRRKFIKLTRIRITRNLKGYLFCSQMSQKQFEMVQEYLEMILALMTGDFDGTYEKIIDMTEERKRELKLKHFIFDNNDKILATAGVFRHWPYGRGVFINSSENFSVWVNPHDHVKVISVEHGGNLRRVYERAMNGLRKLSRDLNFIMSKRMGYVTVCPADMGTGLKVSMHLHLPYLGKKQKTLEIQAEEMNIYIKKVPQEEDLFEICNKKRMGITEIECVKVLEHAAVSLMAMEEAGANTP